MKDTGSMRKDMINHEEYIILKNIDTDYQGIARCRENNLFVYEDIEETCYAKYHDLKVYNHLFLFIKWNHKHFGNCNYFNIEGLIDQYERLNDIGKYEVNPNQLTLNGTDPNIT